MSKFILKWGVLLLAVVAVLSLAVPNAALARDPIEDGPIIGTEPETNVPGDNDGVAGVKIKYHDGSGDGGDYLGAGVLLVHESEDGVVSSYKQIYCARAFWLFMIWMR